MEVSPNAGTGPAPKVTGKSLLASRLTPAASDAVSFRAAETVNSALRQTPDIRPEAVQRAAENVSNVQYPPLETIQAISNLLAIGLGQNDGTA
jgi:hypothetical protein